MTKQVLLVDPLHAKDRLRELQSVVGDSAVVTAVEDFVSARSALREMVPDLVVTNLRLRAYNGIHLALLAGRNRTPCIVYTNEHDLLLARQAQAAGAFYLRSQHLPFTLPAFLGPAVPPQDRRDPAVLDRRGTTRRGRRSTDLPELFAGLQGPSALTGDRPH